jgi:hypothetical protein
MTPLAACSGSSQAPCWRLKPRLRSASHPTAPASPCLVAVRAQPVDLAELPAELAPADPDREWWVLYLDRAHGQSGGPAVMIIEGAELRDLLCTAGLFQLGLCEPV